MTWKLKNPYVEIVHVDSLKFAEKCPTWAVQLFIDGRLKASRPEDAMKMFTLDSAYHMGSPDVLIKQKTPRGLTYRVMEWNEFYSMYEQLPEAARES
jgi:hypothetical protein